MAWRKVWVVVLAAAVVVISAGVILTITLTRPVDTPPPPLEGDALRFEVMQPSYRVGENVTFVVRNYLSHRVCLTGSAPWDVQRYFEGEWRAVETHGGLTAVVTLRFGESRMWEWIAETRSYYQDLGMPPVDPGNYRVLLPIVLDCERWDGLVTLSTYFQLV